MRIGFESVQLQRRKIAGPLFFAAALFYLSFHAFNGERGLYALFKQTRALDSLQAELLQVSAERVALEHHVRLLENTSLDLDLLDEQARSLVGMAQPGEVVIFPAQQ